MLPEKLSSFPPEDWPRPSESGTLLESTVLVVRYTRHWVQYGAFTMVSICILIGAVEGVLAR